jgi:hypothetical protein
MNTYCIRVTALLSLLLCLPLVVAPARAATAADKTGGGVVLSPSDAQGNEIKTPGYFVVSEPPGASIQLYALVGNIQQVKVKVSLAPVDAGSGVYGGISYNLPQQPRKHVGAWLRLSNKVFRLPPGKARVVGVAVTIPAGTAPGQYVGGLTAFVPAATRGSIIVQLRRVVAVVVTVTGGPAFGRFTIGSVRPKHRPDAYYVVTHIHNSGTILLKGRGHIWVWQNGRKSPVISARLKLDTTVPQTTVNYPVYWSKRPQPGIYAYKVSLAWTQGTTTSAGRFRVR